MKFNTRFVAILAAINMLSTANAFALGENDQQPKCMLPSTQVTAPARDADADIVGGQGDEGEGQGAGSLDDAKVGSGKRIEISK